MDVNYYHMEKMIKIRMDEAINDAEKYRLLSQCSKPRKRHRLSALLFYLIAKSKLDINQSNLIGKKRKKDRTS